MKIEGICSVFRGAFVWDQSGISLRIIGIMRVSFCLGAILIPEYLDFHSGYSASRNIFRNIFLFRSIQNERALAFIDFQLSTGFYRSITGWLALFYLSQFQLLELTIKHNNIIIHSALSIRKKGFLASPEGYMRNMRNSSQNVFHTYVKYLAVHVVSETGERFCQWRKKKHQVKEGKIISVYPGCLCFFSRVSIEIEPDNFDFRAQNGAACKLHKS